MKGVSEPAYSSRWFETPPPKKTPHHVGPRRTPAPACCSTVPSTLLLDQGGEPVLVPAAQQAEELPTCLNAPRLPGLCHGCVLAGLALADGGPVGRGSLALPCRRHPFHSPPRLLDTNPLHKQDAEALTPS